MVRNGIFTAELVEAESKTPCTEHTFANGETIAPFLDFGKEYFVKVSLASDPQQNNRPRVLCRLFINGVSLGYTVRLGSKESFCGLWSRNSGHSVDRAFRFVDTPRPPPSTTDGFDYDWGCGTIDVEFYEAIFVGYNERKDITISVANNDLRRSTYEKGGNVRIKLKNGQQKEKFRKGQLIERITFKYCSAEYRLV